MFQKEHSTWITFSVTPSPLKIDLFVSFTDRTEIKFSSHGKLSTLKYRRVLFKEPTRFNCNMIATFDFSTKTIHKSRRVMHNITFPSVLLFLTGKLFSLWIEIMKAYFSYCLGLYNRPHQTQNTIEHARNNNLNILWTNEHLFVLQTQNTPHQKPKIFHSFSLSFLPQTESPAEHVHRSVEWKTDSFSGNISGRSLMSCISIK